MPGRFDSWQSYFYPETIDPLTGVGTLRNLLDERDAAVLAQLEYGRTSRRAADLAGGQVAIPLTFDGAHLRAIHRHLFQDVYEWAGEYRTVSMSKGIVGRGFGDVKTGEVDRYLADVRQLVTSTDWRRIDRDDFVATAATVFAYVNQAHPFREGNGRTSKLFMAHVAELSPYRFEFGNVTPEQWNNGSALSGPDLFAYAPDPRSLAPVFAAVTVDRTEPAPAAADAATQVRDALSASYPHPARAAVRQRPQGAPEARRESGGPGSRGRPSDTGRG